MFLILRFQKERRLGRILKHNYRLQGKAAAERNYADRRLWKTARCESGCLTFSDWKYDCDLLMTNHHGKGREGRGFILSAPEMPDITEDEFETKLKGIGEVGAELMNLRVAEKRTNGKWSFRLLRPDEQPDKVAGESLAFDLSELPYSLLGHRDRFHPHTHGAFCASNGYRCIDFSPRHLIWLQSFAWVSERVRNLYQIESGRGHGRRSREVGRVSYGAATKADYGLSREMNIAQSAPIYSEIIEKIGRGEIEVARRRKDGTPISVLIAGKKIRLSTLRKASVERIKRKVRVRVQVRAKENEYEN